MTAPVSHTFLPVRQYDLAATLSSGQAFRWKFQENAWLGVVGEKVVRLRQSPDGIAAECFAPVSNWNWLRHYLQTEVNLEKIIATFPDDDPMRAATSTCPGLRLLRQEPWECLASFILSSTKQIVQIQQIIELLCARFGEPLPGPAGFAGHSFPSPARIAAVTESELRACKMGFRAPYLLETSRRLAAGHDDLSALNALPMEKAREGLLSFPGVGRKIADCVLLFAYDFPEAFPVDVWIMKALRRLYFPKRAPKLKRLLRFSETYFGPNAGFAQQYLFHYMRTKMFESKPGSAPK